MARVNRPKLLVTVLCIGILVTVWHRSRTNDEEKVRTILNDLATLTTFSGNKNLPVLLGRAKRIAAKCSEDIRFILELKDVEPITVNGRAELERHILAAYRALDSLEVSFTDLEFEKGEEGPYVRVRLSALGSMPGEEGQFLEMHLVGIAFKKVDSELKITEIQQLANLRE